MIPKTLQFAAIARNTKIAKMAVQHRPKPSSNQRNWYVQSSSQLFVKFHQLPSHSLPYCVPQHDEFSLLGSSANMRKSQKIKRLWFAQSFALTVFRREPSKFDQSGFIGVQFKIELFKTLNERLLELLNLLLVLEAHHEVITKTHDYDIARCMLLPPCGTPSSISILIPSSSTPAFSHFLM